MKKLLSLFILMHLPMLVSAQTASDVKNSGCLRETRGIEEEPSPTIVLTKEGSVLTVELRNYISNCCTDDFNVTSSISGGSDGGPCSVSVSVAPASAWDCDCECPFNVSFTVRDLEPNSFYLNCWWYKGQVELKEGEPLVLEYKIESVVIDDISFNLLKIMHKAMLMRWATAEKEIRVPSEVIYEGETYSVTCFDKDAFWDLDYVTKITIPKTIRSTDLDVDGIIWANPFRESTSIEWIEVEEGCPLLSSVDGVLFAANKTMLLGYPIASQRETYIVPEGVTNIRSGTFVHNKYLRKLVIPEEVTYLGWHLFSDTKSLEELYIKGVLEPECMDDNLFGGMSTNVVVYVQPSEVDKYKAIYKGPVYPLPEQPIDNMAYRPLVKEGKHWTYDNFMPLRPAEYDHYYYYDLKGDTLIAGRQCLKMYSDTRSNDSAIRYEGALYEENKKVYCFFPNQDKAELLYDFDCAVGDTLNVYIGQLVVTDIQSEALGDITIKKYTLQPVVSDEEQMGEIFWIEGVGATKDFFGMLPLPGNYNTLNACELNGEMLYQKIEQDLTEEGYHRMAIEGKRWNYIHYYIDEDGEHYDPYSYVVKGDTVIRRTTYKKLYYQDEKTERFECLLLETGRTVYKNTDLGNNSYVSTILTSFFDFDRNDFGRVFTWKSKVNSGNTNWMPYGVDTIQVNNRQFRRFTCLQKYSKDGETLTSIEYGGEGVWNDIWVEGVGSASSGIEDQYPPHEPPMRTPGEYTAFVSCYEDGECIFTAEDFTKPSDSPKYFSEGTKWKEIRLDTLKYDSWYSKVGDEWVPNFETVEYYVRGEYTDRNRIYKKIYTNGPEWTDSLTLMINEDVTEYDTYIGATTPNLVEEFELPGEAYQLEWYIGKELYYRDIIESNLTSSLLPQKYGIIENIKEGFFGGVKPLKYVDLDGVRIIHGIGVTEWKDGECLFGQINPYKYSFYNKEESTEERHYRSMLVYFERNGEVLYDVWPEKVQMAYYYYKGTKIPLTLNESKVCVNIPKECKGTSERVQANAKVLTTINDETFDIFVISRSDFEKLTSLDSWEEDSKSMILTSVYFTERNEKVYSTPYLTIKLKKEQDIDLLKSYAEKYKLRIVKNMPLMPLWYILSVTLESEKSPLECANELWETGYFASSEPDFAADDYGIEDPYRPFVEEGKVWKVGTIPNILGNPVQIVDYYYFDGDTIIDGKTCKLMMCQRYVSPDYSNDYWTPKPSLNIVGAWYEEGKKVYFYNTEKERDHWRLKYDFSLDADETVCLFDDYPPFIIGPRQTGGLKGFKGVYRDVMINQDIRSTIWLEGVGGLDAPFRNAYPDNVDRVPEFLMSCTVGDEVIYLNDEYEDGATPKSMDAKKNRFDFTHTIKTKPHAPRRNGSGDAEESEMQPLYGEYNDLQLSIHLNSLDDTYQVRITNESGQVVYEKTINAGSIVALSIDISAYAKGRYTVTLENSRESFTGEFEAQTTGIEAITNNKEVIRHNIYNLQGQRLSSLQKGLNIVNGQKIFVK